MLTAITDRPLISISFHFSVLYQRYYVTENSNSEMQFNPVYHVMYL